MSVKRAGWSRRYQKALRNYLAQRAGANLQPALGLGRRAVALGLETLDLARIHRQALMALVSPGDSFGARERTIRRAKDFFAEAITPIEKTHHAALKSDVRVRQLSQTLHRRTAESAASTRRLKRSVIQRQGAEEALRKSGIRHTRLVAEAQRLQKRLRHLTRGRLSMQERERQRMSHKLHDDIAQTLLGIHVRLLTLKKAARANTEGFKKEIANTQRLVEKSVQNVKRFTHECVVHHET
jgi:two-component system, NarL family, sensor histidine kinase DegS